MIFKKLHNNDKYINEDVIRCRYFYIYIYFHQIFLYWQFQYLLTVEVCNMEIMFNEIQKAP